MLEKSLIVIFAYLLPIAAAVAIAFAALWSIGCAPEPCPCPKPCEGITVQQPAQYSPGWSVLIDGDKTYTVVRPVDADRYWLALDRSTHWGANPASATYTITRFK